MERFAEPRVDGHGAESRTAKLRRLVPATSQPIKVGVGHPLCTLIDVRKYLLALPEADRERPEWQRTARLLLKAAQRLDGAGRSDSAVRSGRALVSRAALSSSVTQKENPMDSTLGFPRSRRVENL